MLNVLHTSHLWRSNKLLSLCNNSVRCVSSGGFVENRPLNFVEGKRTECVDPSGSFLIEEPATGQVICSMQGSGSQDVDAAVRSAKKAQVAWGQTSGFERSKILLKAANLLEKRKEEIARLEIYDTGKPIWETRTDVQTAVDAIQYYSGLAPTLCGEHFMLPSGSFAYTRREPLGVVAGIGAWNFPIQIASWKTAPALACGNAVVYKPSPFTPLSAVVLGEVFAESGLPDGLYNVVQGGAETGNHLTRHHDVAKVTFTGSVKTGTKVMEGCAPGIKYMTLELGGKSPIIIFDDCDINNAVNATLMGNFLSQGQVCSNGTRVYIHENIFEELLSRLTERTRAINHGDPHLETTKSGAMINADHANNVLGFIERAKEQGAKIICGGELVEMSDQALKGKFIAPCIVCPTDEMEISQEEVFGPVMNVYSFKTEDEVVSRANDTDFGLASAVFTKDLMRAHRVAAKLQAGGCYINNYNIYPIEVPFGGFKKSGVGKENGKTTVEYFTQLKTVYVEANDVECPL